MLITMFWLSFLDDFTSLMMISTNYFVSIHSTNLFFFRTDSKTRIDSNGRSLIATKNFLSQTITSISNERFSPMNRYVVSLFLKAYWNDLAFTFKNTLTSASLWLTNQTSRESKLWFLMYMMGKTPNRESPENCLSRVDFRWSASHNDYFMFCGYQVCYY